MEAHETHETIEAAAHGHGRAPEGRNKRIALLISALAALLAITEMGGKNAQNNYVAHLIEASNLWAFYQAKTIRMTTLRAAADGLETLMPEGIPAERAKTLADQIAEWRTTADRYESEPSTQEGRRELSARAHEDEQVRDHALVTYHFFEYAAAALQLAIVLASAAVITGVVWLAFISGGLGLVGLGLCVLGWFTPTT